MSSQRLGRMGLAALTTQQTAHCDHMVTVRDRGESVLGPHLPAQTRPSLLTRQMPTFRLRTHAPSGLQRWRTTQAVPFDRLIATRCLRSCVRPHQPDWASQHLAAPIFSGVDNQRCQVRFPHKRSCSPPPLRPLGLPRAAGIGKRRRSPAGATVAGRLVQGTCRARAHRAGRPLGAQHLAIGCCGKRRPCPQAREAANTRVDKGSQHCFSTAKLAA